MAGKHKQKRQLKDQTINHFNNSSESSSNEPSTNKSEIRNKKSNKISSRRISVIRSRSPINQKSNKKTLKSKENPKVEKSEILVNSSSIDSDTGSIISKRRRRETRNISVEQIIESQNITAQPVEITKSRRRRSGLPNLEDNKIVSAEVTMASSSSQRTNTNDNTPQLNNDQSKYSLPSTSRGKRNNQSKIKSKFPQFNISSGRDSGIFLSNDNAFQGIVSSGMDISHFQNYLNSRSLSSSEIGDQINKKLDELHSAAGDRTQEYMLMSEINQHLLVSYEDSLNSLRVSELTSQVVTLIQNCEDNLVDLKNICYNVLLHLMEALPRSSDYLVSSLGMFLNKISNLFDFDSLEQIINVIERISRRHGQDVLQCGSFTIILNYYDFLTAPQQLTILNMISQCFTNLKASDFIYIIDGIENLTNRLKQSEPKCVEKVIQCFVRLVSAFQNDEVKLKKLASNNLFVNLQELLISSPPVVSDIHEIIQMMAILCSNCSDLAVDLIKQNITQTILCVCNSMNSDSSSVSNCNNRSVEEILALVNLIAELMPVLPPNEDLFIINRVINPTLSKSSKNVSNSIYNWYWFNSTTKQWIAHPQNVCLLLEKNLQSNEFEFSCQSNGLNIDVNLILMQQIQIYNGSRVICDLKRAKHQVKQSQKNYDTKVDSRRKLLLEQCMRFENSDLCDNVEAVELIRHLFPLLIDIYNEASSYQVRYKCLEAIIRMIYPTTNKTLNSVLNKTSLSSLMATLLSSQDSVIIINAIQMGIILKRLPPSLILNFKKEGVLYQLDKMLSYWKEKPCEIVTNTYQSTSYFSNESDNLAMTVSAPSGTLDQLSLENLNYLNEKPENYVERFVDNSSSNVPTNTTQRFTNWIMKRSGCIGRPVTTDVPVQSLSKNRKQRIELEQALDMSIKPISDPQNPTSKRINQIMSMLNLNTSLASLDSKPGFNDKIHFENPNKENYCKQWIVKFGCQLNSDWKEIGEESINQKISSISSFNNGQHQKKDVMFYLKEVVTGLRSENNILIKNALILYSELLSNDCYISVFEMESSGINEALLDFFTNVSNLESKREQFIAFLDVYMHKYLDNKNTFVKKPFVSLVNHVLMCLHQQEQFHVRMFQFPTSHSRNAPNSSTKLALQPRFNLTQALTEAVLGRMSSHRRIDNNPRNIDSSIIEARILPNILLESSFSRSSSKITDVECHFSPYPYDIHVSDTSNCVEQWSGGEFISFNNSFNVILDVLGTISSIEKIVMREIARHRRITKRFGIMTKESSINDSSDSDDDYDCDAINESLLSGEIDYQDDISEFADINFTGNNVKKHKTISDKLNSFNLFHLNSAHSSNAKSTTNVKTRGKQSSISKTLTTASNSSSKTNNNTLTKFRESGLRALANKRNTKQSPYDSESHAVTPSTSSACSSSLVTSTSQGTVAKSTDSHSSKLLSETDLKPISKMQILIGDTILPTEMTLYQAIRRYSSHVTQFLANQKGVKTDQELEEAINQVIWKSNHNIYYRPVAATSQAIFQSRQNFKSVNVDSISTLNFMASLMSSASQTSRLSSHVINDQFRVNPSTATLSNSSHINIVQNTSIANTRQRTFHKKVMSSQVQSQLEPEQSTTTCTQALRHKRRRKNNTDTSISIGRNSNNSQKILFSNISKKLPYPILIDYPSIFEPIPNKSDKVNKPALSDDSDTNKQTYDLTFNMSQKLVTTLALLRCLNAINKHWHVLTFNLYCNTLIPENEFRSQKLSSKANRQLQDTFSVLARNLPFWCIQLFHACAFLFSVETRQNFFYLFNFDRARTLLYLEGASNQESDNFLDSTNSEVRRMRVQVNRSDRLLEESELLLKNQTDPRVILEISFNNEAGFGLGPTNEFYTQVSTCMLRSDLMLWYTSGETLDEFVTPSPHGLYPRPIYNKNKKLDNKIRNKFIFLGRLMARALLDCRKLDIPLNPVFYKWLLGQEESIHTADLYYIDPVLYNQLTFLHEIVDKKILIDSDKTLSPVQKKEAYEELGVDDLMIVFVHPLYTQIELVKDGENRVVTIHDLSLYLDLVASVTLIDGVRSQIECVIEGFDSLLPGARMHLSALFEAHEIEEIFCGGRVEDNQPWDVKTLTEVCTCDHGYTMNSRSIINLFEIMSEFTKEQRRHFVQFCTGTPRLPVGGFRALKPPFKIVNKKEGGENPDNYLPSVMTCQNFLKLPDYSSKEVMRQRLLYALHEGQNAFFLS